MSPTDALCTDCGICCDGTLFSSVSLDAPGIASARLHRLPMLETAEAFKFELPCAALRGVLCGIYAERPEACGDYACALRVLVEEELLELDEARVIIAATKAARRRVTGAIGATAWWTARRAALAAGPDGDATLLADLNELEELVRVNFWA